MCSRDYPRSHTGQIRSCANRARRRESTPQVLRPSGDPMPLMKRGGSRKAGGGTMIQPVSNATDLIEGWGASAGMH